MSQGESRPDEKNRYAKGDALACVLVALAVIVAGVVFAPVF